jgi:hypothetical protein
MGEVPLYSDRNNIATMYSLLFEGVRGLVSAGTVRGFRFRVWGFGHYKVHPRIQNQKSEIRNPKSKIRNPESGTRNPKPKP